MTAHWSLLAFLAGMVTFALLDSAARRRLRVVQALYTPDIRLSARRDGVDTWVDLAEDITAAEMIAVSLALSRDGWLRAWAEQGAEDAERWLAETGDPP